MRGEFSLRHSPLSFPTSPLQQRHLYSPSITTIAEHFWSISFFFRRADSLCCPMQSAGNSSCIGLHAPLLWSDRFAYRINACLRRLPRFNTPCHHGFYTATTSTTHCWSLYRLTGREDHFQLELQQRNRALAVWMQKAMVARAPKSFGQRVLQD